MWFQRGGVHDGVAKTWQQKQQAEGSDPEQQQEAESTVEMVGGT